MTEHALSKDRGAWPAKQYLAPLQTMLLVAAVVILVVIAALTLGPVRWRPHIIGANVDRFVGFLILGSFLTLAQPRRFFMVCAVIIAGAVFLEYLQSFMQGRHGVLHDFEFKVVGGLLGAGIARTFTGAIRIF